MTVTVNPIPSVPVITYSAPSACVGSTISLTASSTAPGLAAVGTGTVVNGTTTYPSPYGQFYGAVHEQYLITAAELAAANIVAGPITSIAFDQTVGYTYTALANFQMNIAATAATSMTSNLITTGFQNVVASGTYTPPASTGWATLNFSAPFTWNGSSNIVVDLSFSNCSVCNGTSSCTTAFTSNGSVNQTSTAYPSTVDMHADGNCTINTFAPLSGATPFVGTTYNQRPNMRLNAVTSSSGATTYNWSNGAVGATVSAVTTGLSNTYSVIASSPFGCTSTNSVTINVNPAPAPVLNYTTDQNLCTGVDLNFTVSDLNALSYAGFVVDWTPSITNQSPSLPISSAVLGSPVQARVHTIDNGCSALSNSVNVTYTTVTVSTTTVPASCAGADGSITANAVGVGPFTYVYSDFSHNVIHTVSNSASSTNTYSGLATGTYYVTVTGNSNGANTTIPSCPSAEQTVTVGGSTAFTIATSSANESCPGLNNGSATVIITGGSGNFGILWSPGGATTATISPLAPGTYSVQVTDHVSGCISSTTATVVAAPLITFNVTTTNVTCFGLSNGSASVNFTGSAIFPTNYAWLDGNDINTANILVTDGDLIGVPAGTYYVYALDGNSCGQYSAAVIITQPAQVSVTSFTPTHSLVGATVTINGSGFTVGSTVSFNGTLATSVTYVSASQVTAVVPTGATTGPITVATGVCSATSTGTFTVDVPTFTTFNLKGYLEGYYLGGGLMNAVNFNIDGVSPSTEADSILVELHDPLNPLAAIEPHLVMLNTNGTTTVTFSAAISGGSYYVAVHGRNIIETWSHNPITFTSVTSYDFSTSSLQAFDDGINLPMKDVGLGVWAFYSGDINQDGTVDGTDIGAIDNDASTFAFGYNVTDITGDGASDGTDLGLSDNNSQLFLFTAHP